MIIETDFKEGCRSLFKCLFTLSRTNRPLLKDRYRLLLLDFTVNLNCQSHLYLPSICTVFTNQTFILKQCVLLHFMFASSQFSQHVLNPYVELKFCCQRIRNSHQNIQYIQYILQYIYRERVHSGHIDNTNSTDKNVQLTQK